MTTRAKGKVLASRKSSKTTRAVTASAKPRKPGPAARVPSVKYYSIGGFKSPPEGNNILKQEDGLYSYLGEGKWVYKDSSFLQDPVWIVKEISRETAKNRWETLCPGKPWVP